MFIWLFSKYFFWIQISWLRVQSFSIQSKAHLWFISSNICGVRAGEVGPVLVLFFIFFNPLTINLWPVLEQTYDMTFFLVFWMSATACLRCEHRENGRGIATHDSGVTIIPKILRLCRSGNVDIFVPTFANTIEITCNPQHVRSCLFLRI